MLMCGAAVCASSGAAAAAATTIIIHEASREVAKLGVHRAGSNDVPHQPPPQTLTFARNGARARGVDDC